MSLPDPRPGATPTSAPHEDLPLAVTSLRLAGFRKHRDKRTFSFEGPNAQPLPTVVIAGTNGAGKTALLEGLLLALGQGDAIASADVPSWRCSVPPGAVIEASIWAGGRRFDLPSATALWPPSPLLNRIAYYSSGRAPHLVGAIEPAPTASGSPALTEANRVWRLKRRILNARARTAFRSDERDQAAGWLKRLNEAWQTFRDDETRLDAGLVERGSTEPLADVESLADIFLYRGAEIVCSVDELSSGELELLGFFCLVLFDGFDEGGIVVIDEPELHLHDRWQATLLAALRVLLPRVQIIVATHSGYLWDAVPSYARIEL